MWCTHAWRTHRVQSAGSEAQGLDPDASRGARARAQTDILDHKEQQAGVAARRLQALEAQLDALRGELARSSAQAAAAAVR